MAAARYSSTLYAEDGQQYLLEIYDADFAGTSQGFLCTALEIKYEGSNEDMFFPVIASTLRIGILVNEEYSHMETFYNDLVGAREGRFSVRIISGKTLPLTLDWMGYILHDLVQREDLPNEAGWVINIDATDGIGRLRSIPYNDDGTTYTGYETINNHLLNCINKLEVIDVFYGTANVMRVMANWWEDSMTYSATSNPLTLVEANHKNFVTIDRNGNTDYMSCYAVLRAIAAAFGARIIFSGSSYWFQQINELQTPTSVTTFNYQKTGTESNTTGVDLTVANDQTDVSNTDLLRLTGGIWKPLAPIRRSAVSYRYFGRTNVAAGAKWTKDSNAAFVVDDVNSNNGTAVIRWQAALYYISTKLAIGTFKNHFFKFKITVNIGTKYLKRDVTISSGSATYGAPSWTASAADYYYYVAPLRTIAEDGLQLFVEFNLADVPPLPEDGDLTLRVELDGIVDQDDSNAVVLLDSYDWQFVFTVVEILQEGTIDSQANYYEYSSTNDVVGNSKENIIATILGDGKTTTSPGTMRVVADSSPTDAWRVGNSGTYKAFSQLLANERIRCQLSPVERYSGQMIHVNGSYRPHQVVEYNSKYYMFLSGTFDLQTGIWTGEWVELATGTGYTEQDVIERAPSGGEGGGGNAGTIPGTQPPPSGGGGGTDSGGTGSGGGVTSLNLYQEVVTSTGSATLPAVTEGDGTLPDAKALVKVTQADTGQRVKPADITIDGENGQVTLSWTPGSGENFLIEWFVIT